MKQENEESSKSDKQWLNLQKYEAPQSFVYPRNPFCNDRHSSQQPSQRTFHVGMKFQGEPHEMLKLVCLALIQIEIEWQYDTKEMKLKCRTKVDDNKLVDDDKFIEDFIRQQFLKFYVYINKQVKGSNSSNSQSKKRRPPAAQN